MENLEVLASLKNQVEEFRLQDKINKPNFNGIIKKVFEPETDTIKDTFENLTKTTTETSTKNNKAFGNLKNKLLELMDDTGIIASYLLPPQSKITNPEFTSQIKLLKDSSSNRVNDLLTQNNTNT